jgi:Big-like domain-containing protein
MIFKRAACCLLLFALAIFGCGGGSSDSTVSATQVVGPPTAQLTLRLTNPVARIAASTVTTIRLTGASASGVVVFGPVIVERSEENSWMVPTSVERLILEFMTDDGVVGVYSVAVNLQPGETLVLEDPDFIDAASPLASLQIKAESTVFPLNYNPRLTVQGTFQDGSQADLSGSADWSVLDSSVADINSSGLLSPKTPGQATVRATVLDVSAELALTITDVILNKIQVEPESFRIAAATSTQLVAKGLYSDGSVLPLTDGVTWASDLEAIATVDSTGRVVGQTPGITMITARFGVHSATATAEISSAALTELTVSQSQDTVSVGQTSSFKAEGKFSDGTIRDLTDFVTWGSSNSGVAVVDVDGLATGVGPGQAVIIANDPESSMMASSTLTVISVPVTSGPIAAQVATTLIFSGVPDTIGHGTNLPPITVSVLDQFGLPMPGATGTATLSLTAPPARPSPETVILVQNTGSGNTGSGNTGSGNTGSGSSGSGTGSSGSGTGSGPQPPDGSTGPNGETGLVGTLSKPLSSGKADFDDLIIYTSGTYVLKADLGGPEGTSKTFIVTFP